MPVSLPSTRSMFSRHLQAFAHMLAHSAAFRAAVGAANPAAALARIHWPYALDELVTPGNPASPMIDPRPRAVLNPGTKYVHAVSNPRHTAGNLLWHLELLPEGGDTRDPRDRRGQLLHFMVVVGNIIADLDELVGTNDPLFAGETFLNALRYALVNGPAESFRENENDQFFYGVSFEVEWN